jgi:hypothetical protein
MAGHKSYSESLFDQEQGSNSDPWISVLYEDVPIAYASLSDSEVEMLNPEGRDSEDYDMFLMRHDRYRSDLSSEVRVLNSFDVVDEAFEANPGVLHNLAGYGINRDIEKEIEQRFEEHDDKMDSDMEGFGAMFTHMGEIVTAVLDGRLEEFKGTMDRQKLVENSSVVYGSGLEDLYSNVNEFQRRQ